MQQLEIEMMQLNFIVGDLEANYQKIVKSYKESNADLVIFSELSLTGYSPEDLLLHNDFLEAVEKNIERICKITLKEKKAIIVGAPIKYFLGKKTLIYNSALLIYQGEVKKISTKKNLPNYGIFDEKRYFKEADTLTTVKFKGVNIALLICEDLFEKRNIFLLSNRDLDIMVCINASPFEVKKLETRVELARKFSTELKKPLIYVNQIGGQDEVVFDGSSFALSSSGNIEIMMKEFSEDKVIVKYQNNKIFSKKKYIINHTSDLNNKDISYSRIYKAIILAIRDYFHKNSFTKAVIGLSGGIDSAIVGVLSVDALSSKNVRLVALPSEFNSQQSLIDAENLSNNLSIKLEIISIQDSLSSIKNSLAFDAKEIVIENLQSRIRGDILMAISNQDNALLLTTGNKSELATGYSTIYGDMCGAFNPIKDLYKTQIYELAKFRNNNITDISLYKKKDLISKNILTKEPSAELRFNQKDSDSLPPYSLLDKILYLLIEERKSVNEITSIGYDKEVVQRIYYLLKNSEYKRRQAAIGVKLSNVSFDKDRRYPICNNYRP